jgi:uncharacterized protein YbjT (DUF2867 family)
MSKNLLITGATGQQGGSTIKALLASPQASDFTIFAVTRNAESGSAKKLQERGVRIVQGDMNDVPAIFRDAEKVAGKIWGVYSIQVRSSQSKTAACCLQLLYSVVSVSTNAHSLYRALWAKAKQSRRKRSKAKIWSMLRENTE